MKVCVNLKRPFQLWQHVVSHGMLLLRSPKGDQFATRVDIVFTNVQATCMRTSFPDLEVKQCEAGEAAQIRTRFGLQEARDLDVFVLKAAGMPDGYVVASAMDWHEDVKDFSDRSHFDLPLMVHSYDN